MREQSSTELSLSIVEGEPRVLDLDLAAYLGFESPFSIRKIIRRHEDALTGLGVVSTVEITPGAKGGRPGVEYRLNRSQATFITAKSETPTAVAKTVEIVRRFDEYENGPRRELSPAEFLLQQAQMLVAVEREQKAIVQKQEKQDRQIAQQERRLNQIETATDYFTCIGYARWAKHAEIDTSGAADLGRRAASLCKSMGVAATYIPDGRYGKVRSYPKAVLDIAWAELHGVAQ